MLEPSDGVIAEFLLANLGFPSLMGAGKQLMGSELSRFLSSHSSADWNHPEDGDSRSIYVIPAPSIYAREVVESQVLMLQALGTWLRGRPRSHAFSNASFSFLLFFQA